MTSAKLHYRSFFQIFNISQILGTTRCPFILFQIFDINEIDLDTLNLDFDA